MVVMRSLAKDPDDRYQNAEEMSADLDRVARGVGVAPETEETATQIMRSPMSGPLAMIFDASRSMGLTSSRLENGKRMCVRRFDAGSIR